VIGQPNPSQEEMLYLDGDIYLQISPPKWSTETRLITYPPKDGKYHLKYYDTVKYESQCFYFNLFDRVDQYQYMESDALSQHLMGFDDSYERVGEYFICHQYLTNYKKETGDLKSVVRMIYEIHTFLTSITEGTTILGCAIKVVSKDLRTDVTRIEGKIKEKKPWKIKDLTPMLQNPANDDAILEQVDQGSHLTVQQLVAQKKIIASDTSGILTSEQIASQVATIDKEIANIKRQSLQITTNVEKLIDLRAATGYDRFMSEPGRSSDFRQSVADWQALPEKAKVEWKTKKGPRQ
jgi:hypothetical protein